VRPVYWQGILGNIQALPTDARPVKSWSDLDEAFFNVTEGIRNIVEEQARKAEEVKMNRARTERVIIALENPNYDWMPSITTENAAFRQLFSQDRFVIPGLCLHPGCNHSLLRGYRRRS
jgi:hypothetical protein